MLQTSELGYATIKAARKARVKTTVDTHKLIAEDKLFPPVTGH